MSTERRLAELSLEIRNYPTPIARCDEQLAALLEERARLIERLQRPACEPLELWVNDGGPSRR
ncbi:MAG: hypothetical protein A3G28_02080 [Betaproteobacteria bacterium RIFCSPLOWO2_12_FULL_68_19]|nr:MAG: hypothetical protein A3G28_02080 [Betaproteobacteria bacterium RIFCSPLOWO2_12_FULL_68_19]